MRKTGDPTSTTDSDFDSESGEGFLGRWSRRKRATHIHVDEQETQTARIDGHDDGLSAPAPAPAPVDESSNTELDTPPVVADAAPDADNTPVLTDADMPALESLGDDDDYSGFMSTGVSEGLRNKALRRLFSSAQFNVLDGLNDYDDDFTNFEPLGDIITSDMRHRMEEEAKKAAQQLRDEGISSEQSLTNAQRPELSASSEDVSQPTLDSQGESQQIDELTAEDDVCDQVGEPVAASTNERALVPDEASDDADDLPRRSEAPDEARSEATGHALGESPAAIAIPRSDARDV
jgi:hypothetical protein